MEGSARSRLRHTVRPFFLASMLCISRDTHSSLASYWGVVTTDSLPGFNEEMQSSLAD
jgi:hypothetical protein